MHLHIVTLNIPFPPDYGGMIDTYYRIQALHDLGVRIHLHCFEYGRKHAKELESLCETISYYKRNTGLNHHLSPKPYIVKSRQSSELLEDLTKDDYPVLFDGMHATSYLDHPLLSARKKIIRLHNVEHKYYRSLVKSEHNLFKKIYFLIESAKLMHYEKILNYADLLLPISDKDLKYFSGRYQHSVLIPPFHPFTEIKSLPGIGEYIIYHGDLSVNENEAVCETLIKEVFSKIPHKCIIAGKDPSDFVKSLALRYSNIRAISNPDEKQMNDLIANAQINLLPALSDNGFKLKLIMALYEGRYCIVNQVLGENATIRSLCQVAGSSEEMIKMVTKLMNEPFTEEMIAIRKKQLSESFDVIKNAQKLVDLIF